MNFSQKKPITNNPGGDFKTEINHFNESLGHLAGNKLYGGELIEKFIGEYIEICKIINEGKKIYNEGNGKDSQRGIISLSRWKEEKIENGDYSRDNMEGFYNLINERNKKNALLGITSELEKKILSIMTGSYPYERIAKENKKQKEAIPSKLEEEMNRIMEGRDEPQKNENPDLTNLILLNGLY